MSILNIFNKKVTPEPDRWSVIFKNNDVIEYEMAGDRVDIMLGYYVITFSKGNPTPPWKISLRFNRTNQIIPLKKDFFIDGRYIKDELYDEIESIDPGYLVEWYRMPIFINKITEEIIPISEDYSKRMEQMVKGTYKETVTFFSILDSVFGTS